MPTPVFTVGLTNALLAVFISAAPSRLRLSLPENMAPRKGRRKPPLPKFKIIKIFKTVDANTTQSSVPVSVQSFSVGQTSRGQLYQVPRRRNVPVADATDAIDNSDESLANSTPSDEAVPTGDLDSAITTNNPVQKQRKTETYAVRAPLCFFLMDLI